MRVDIVSIFPEYFAPLDLSLIGKARRSRLLDIAVHDLRDFTHDRHRTVDDTPYGGGAGMVMLPQPWAEALSHIGGQQPGAPTLLVPTPSGRPFTQAVARELAGASWLAFACGRYEGIDERVQAYAAQSLGWQVVPVSLGDYVLNGGEVAVLAMVEAIVRLIEGVVGNEESLTEESHEGGLLEYPVYTKPARWQVGDAAYDVPAVLLSGNHGAITQWRERQRLERTAARRPDLLPAARAAGGLGDFERALATPADAGELLTLTRACSIEEYARHGLLGAGSFGVEQAMAELAQWQTWIWRSEGRLVASVRVRRDPQQPPTWQIARLLIAPDLPGLDLGRDLLAYAESLAPTDIERLCLLTGSQDEALTRYAKAGYRRLPASPDEPATAALSKPRRRTGR
ncbi:tRNA (guanosine(37)-N1)-methyltransferase TrmD [Nostocoides sp.]|uniref:tRNA (guanosine(37)-N1)-methyltransferase TrmD n=1 Tax=Nostocoides sp. TaxID=1917966 RepID=UPI002CB1638D|nr:tRNA (guanosine(37)-N1)-methyltransferase TrmD [Tetrasphaera sp.]